MIIAGPNCAGKTAFVRDLLPKDTKPLSRNDSCEIPDADHGYFRMQLTSI
jgi:hypothetical protein